MTSRKYELMNCKKDLENKPLRVAAYCRVSTDKEDQVGSFESQQSYFRQYISQHSEWELYMIYADEGISGTGTKKRKEFNKMIQAARSGEIDLIITKEISRFARNTLDSIYFTRELKKYGVGVIFMNDGINTLDSDSELRLAIMSSIAQEESRKTSERVKWGQKRRMEQGVVFGRNMLGYDVINGKMYINNDGAKTVRLIFHKFVNEKKGTYVIARELTEEKISPMKCDKWQSSVILRILRNEKYCGDLIQKKTYTPDFLSHEKKYNHGEEKFVIIKDHHEPIISRSIFEAANTMLDEKSASQSGFSKHSSRYPFSGKILCGKCGSGYSARSRKKADGSIYILWQCYGRIRHGKVNGCSADSINNDDVMHIIKLVFGQLNIENNIADEIADIVFSAVKDEKYLSDKTVKSKMNNAEKKRTELIGLYTCGEISHDEFVRFRNEYDNEIKKLSSELERRKSAEDISFLNALRKNISEITSEKIFDEAFFGELTEKIIIGSKNIEVYLKGLPHKFIFSAEA